MSKNSFHWWSEISDFSSNSSKFLKVAMKLFIFFDLYDFSTSSSAPPYLYDDLFVYFFKPPLFFCFWLYIIAASPGPPISVHHEKFFWESSLVWTLMMNWLCRLGVSMPITDWFSWGEEVCMGSWLSCLNPRSVGMCFRENSCPKEPLPAIPFVLSYWAYQADPRLSASKLHYRLYGVCFKAPFLDTWGLAFKFQNLAFWDVCSYWR